MGELLARVNDLGADRPVQGPLGRKQRHLRVRHPAQAIVRPPMATLDQLSAEQRAIIELVLQRGKSYDELADMLAMPESRVRELARDALVSLAPVSARGVDDEWRGQLADYVLGQQPGPESTATEGH